MTKETNNSSQNQQLEKKKEDLDKEQQNRSDVDRLNRNRELMKTPVILKSKAYERIIGYAIRYANDDMNEKDWREVYGILIGTIGNDKKLVIKDAIPMVVGDRAGVKYENKQYVDMAQIDESVYERSIRDKKNDFIIGWWHTHPGFPFQFSKIDQQTQLGYQLPNPSAVGIIFNHCKLKSQDFYLGLAILRLLNPERGIWSSYRHVEFNTEEEQEEILKKALKRVKDIKKNMPRVLKAISYIDNKLRKIRLTQLQKNFGLNLVPKKDVVITKNEEVAEEDEKFLYEWDPEFYKKSFRIPKFRARIEHEIKKIEGSLNNIDKDENLKKYEHKKEKYKNRIQHALSRPNQWYAKIMDDFSKKVGEIYPYYDFLDTNERKVLENFESRSNEYHKVLEALNRKAFFNLTEKNQ